LTGEKCKINIYQNKTDQTAFTTKEGFGILYVAIAIDARTKEEMCAFREII